MLLKYHNIVTKISEYRQYIGGKCKIEPKKSSDRNICGMYCVGAF